MQELLDEFSGNKLKDKREASLLTQEELAREIGVRKLSISQWETRKSRPSKQHLRALISFFKFKSASRD